MPDKVAVVDKKKNKAELSFVDIIGFRILVWLLIIVLFQVSFYFSSRYGSSLLKINNPLVKYNLPPPLRDARDIVPSDLPNSPDNSASAQNNDSLPKTPLEWGVAKQIDDVTWTINVGEDKKMGTPLETFKALNLYRNRHSSQSLVWDERLAGYAQSRAAFFTSIKGLDQHKGFIEFAGNEENIRSLGFWAVGENAAYGYTLEGVHIIEWIFAGDEPHDKNQLEPSWTHVGIGIDGVSVAVIFAKSKI